MELWRKNNLSKSRWDLAALINNYSIAYLYLK